MASMTRSKVLVIGGGPSLEREIALLSAKAVYEALKNQDFDVVFYDWDGKTDWLDINLSTYDVVLPILHGKGGEDGEIQSILERSNAKFLGSRSQISALCFDKDKTLKKLQTIGCDVPAGYTVDFDQYLSSPLSKKAHVLKPFKGGSSIDTYIFNVATKVPIKQIEQSFNKYDSMLLEEYINGIEITVPILDGKALQVIEIHPPKNGVFYYSNKYNGKTEDYCPPKNLSPDQISQAKSLGEMIHSKFGCSHLSRIDMIYVSGKFYVLEINTMPGMTSQSLYPKAARAEGISFDDLVVKFVELTQRDGVR